ncbi:hypothetical protein GQX59_01265 [Brachyspira hyodysenteriae]|nr:hypothetical protein GQX62_01285 [Brachyspira hyodysenteriae]QTM04881.1 hypothetical protein GQX61_01265 [Brachyspira hyodysenteriae]QTM07570.1 hypothetical protein GQX60_01405 [Brachyspira hyodysenteriae]QTM10103.1 hypothetical protein GQX59_01265 [Brachyspira hyodysenteriae]
MSQINLYFCFYIWGFAPDPSSFIGIKEPKELHFYRLYPIFNKHVFNIKL